MDDIKFLDLTHYNRFLVKPMHNFLSEVFSSGDFIKGKVVEEFATKFIQYHNAKYGIPCGNGTDALEIILKCLPLSPCSNIVVPDNTFFATAEAVINSGHNVQICPFDEATQNLCPKALMNLIEKQSIDAVIFVHLYGNTAGIADIKKVCDEHNIFLIEDCAQAHGAKYNDIYVGNYGIAAAFSFYPGKVLGAIGDAGIITTNDYELYDKCLRITDHGRLSKFDHKIIGRNSRMDSIQAKYLSLRIDYLDEDLRLRERCRSFYCKFLDAEKYTVISLDPLTFHGNHQFPVRTKSHTRERVVSKIERMGIPIGCHYPFLLSERRVFNKIQDFDNNDSVQKNLMSLPIGPHLKDEQLHYIVEVLNGV